jgi:hypothetical protein
VIDPPSGLMEAINRTSERMTRMLGRPATA